MTKTEILAVAEFTSDMAQTLHRYFAAYEADGVVTVEVSNRGLWLVHPVLASRQFLGLARLTPSQPKPQIDAVAPCKRQDPH